mgnify:CR=1 FL=1
MRGGPVDLGRWPNRSMSVRVPGALALASMKLAVGQSTALAKGQTQHSQRATPLVLQRATRTFWPTAKFIRLTAPDELFVECRGRPRPGRLCMHGSGGVRVLSSGCQPREPFPKEFVHPPRTGPSIWNTGACGVSPHSPTPSSLTASIDETPNHSATWGRSRCFWRACVRGSG